MLQAINKAINTKTRIAYLRIAAKVDWAPHLLCCRDSHLFSAFVEFNGQTLKNSNAFFLAGISPSFESTLRRCNRAINILSTTHADLRIGLLSRRINDRQSLWLDGINPLTVDIELSVLAHIQRSLLALDQRFTGINQPVNHRTVALQV